MGIIDYKVIFQPVDYLDVAVREHLADGWKVYGSPFGLGLWDVDNPDVGKTPWAAQAMIKEAELYHGED